MLKIVLKTDRTSPIPFAGEDVIGCDRFWHTRGRNMFTLGDWRIRWKSRLYAAMNSAKKSNQYAVRFAKEKEGRVGNCNYAGIEDRMRTLLRR